MKTDGFEGVFFPGDGRKDKVMIVMSGSNGGLGLTKQEAEFYHQNGIPALALALFKTEQTPKDLSRIPVEYVESAVVWLKKQGYQQVGIDGMSKGSEMALLAASILPGISCVIARVPSYFVSEGLAGSGKSKRASGTSCWSWQGKELPYAPYRNKQFNLPKLLLKEKEFHIITFNRDKEVTPESLSPVEKIHAPVLLLSSKHDEVWPSFESACYIEKKLSDIGFRYPHKHVAYEHISHAMTTRGSWLFKLGFRSERDHPKECLEDRAALRKELLDWVGKPWAGEEQGEED